MAASKHRKRNSFAKKAERIQLNLEATEKVLGAAHRLLRQVVGIALTFAALLVGLFFPDLLSTVDRVVALLGRTIP